MRMAAIARVRLYAEVDGKRREVTPAMGEIHWTLERLRLGMTIFEPKGNEKERQIGFFNEGDKPEPVSDFVCRYLIFTRSIKCTARTHLGNFYRMPTERKERR